MVVTQATQAARANVLEVWRRPWEQEVGEHLQDATSQKDYARAEEQRSLQWFMRCHAPRTAEEFEELAAGVKTAPPEAVEALYYPGIDPSQLQPSTEDDGIPTQRQPGQWS
jgi:hypothetical protein